MPGEELAPRAGGLGVALGAADYLAVPEGVHADGDEDGDVLVRPSPASLEVDAVDEDAGVPAHERPLVPFLDGCEGLLVQVGDGARGHRRAPENLGDVLYPPGRDVGEVHLDDGLLD